MKGRRSADVEARVAQEKQGLSTDGPAADALRAVFLDRDGTLVRETRYLADPSRLVLLPKTGQAVAKLKAAGFAVVVVTNQSGIARGLLTEDRVRDIHAKLALLLSRHRACLNGMYFCPHHPAADVTAYRKTCPCRKPGIGLFLQARDDLGLHLSGSYHIGDKRSDLEAAARAGLVSILVLSGYGRQEWEACLSEPDSSPMPDRVARGLAEAADWVLWRELGTEPIRWSTPWLSRRLLPSEVDRWRRAGLQILLVVDKPLGVRSRLPQIPSSMQLRQWVLAAIDIGPAARGVPTGRVGRWVARRIDALSRLAGVDAVTLIPPGSGLDALLEVIQPDAVLDPSKGGEP